MADAAVAGVADRFWGEVVGAAIRPVPGAPPPSEADLAAFCRDRLAPFKVPVRWLLLGSFPLTSTGKVRKDQLSELLAGLRRPPGPAGGPVMTTSPLDSAAIRRHFSFPRLGRIATNNAASTQPPRELLDLCQSLAPGTRTCTAASPAPRAR